MASSSTAAKRKLPPDDEIQKLADTAIRVWSTGVPEECGDSLGGGWRFEPIREGISRVVFKRVEHQEKGDLLSESYVTQAELGVDDPRPMVAARVAAVIAPADAKLTPRADDA